MKKILLVLSLLLLTACSAAPVAKDTAIVAERSAPEVAVNYNNGSVMDIMNFRTSDSMDLISENRIIRTFEEFEAYNSDYTILENPFFIDDQCLNKLQKVNEEYFEKHGFVAVILVESSGSNSVVGENLVLKESTAEAFINRTEAGIGTSDIATRHILYVLNQEDLKNIKEVKVAVSLK